jgi:two-component system NtrC family sensor kinase
MRNLRSLLLFLVVPVLVDGQPGDTLDSLKNLLAKNRSADTVRVRILNDLSKYLARAGDPDAITYSDAAYILASELQYAKGQGLALLYASQYYMNTKNLDLSSKTILNTIAILREIDDDNELIEAYKHSVTLYSNNNNLTQGIEHGYKGLSIAQRKRDTPSMIFFYATLGFSFFYEQNYDQSFNNFSKVYELLPGATDEISWVKPFVPIYLGRVYTIRKQYATAMNFLEDGLLQARRNLDYQAMANAYDAFGEVYTSKAEEYKLSGDHAGYRRHLDTALANYLRAAQNGILSFDSTGLSDCYIRVAETNLKLGNVARAQVYLDSARRLGNITQAKDLFMNLYRVQSTLDSTRGDFKNAYRAMMLHVLYKDSLFSEDNKWRSAQASLQFDFDQQARLAREEQVKKEAAVKRARNIQYTVILLVVLIAIFLLWSNRQKQRSKSKIEKAYSQLKATQAQLLQSEKMASLGELTAGIAHEIQNPLNFVNNFSDLNAELINDAKSELDNGNIEEVKGILNDLHANEEKINHHGKRADSIVKGMLQHSRKSDGKKEATDINALVDEYLRLSYHGLRAKDKSFNASFHTDLDDTIGKVSVVPQDIGRVILNLLNNAFYAVNEKKKQEPVNFNPSVNVSTRKTGDAITITVSDNGPGIPPHIAEKIFQPFFTTKPAGQGTGLGLSMSYDIITKGHGGELKVSSIENDGSVFTIILPAN